MLYSEFWHGQRFKELSWFWDPDSEWLLPCRCHTCHATIGQADILAAIGHGQSDCELVHVVCNDCGMDNEVKPKYTNGDPRNIALIGHWDGWLPFKTAAHSCGRPSSYPKFRTVCTYTKKALSCIQHLKRCSMEQ